MAQGGARKTDSSPATAAGEARALLDIPEVPVPGGASEAPVAPAAEKEARPSAATAAIALMVVAGGVDLALGVYWILWGSNALGGLLFLLVGVAYLFGGRGLHAGESWGWGAGVFAGVFAILFGALLLPFGAAAIAMAIVVIVPLVLVRRYYGMVRYDEEAEAKKKEDFRAERTRNPEGLHCPKCGSPQLWVAADGSAFCETCKRGTISLRPSA